MKRRHILMVDGYNMIGAWPDLNHLQQNDEIQAARDLLLFQLSNYAKYRGLETIVVFDAQFVPGITSTYEQYDLQVVFTKEGETADTYIEREVSQFINPLTRVIVATSDAAEQWMVFKQGALRQSAQELQMDMNYTRDQINHDVRNYYSKLQRRHSPWDVEELEQLDRLRYEIDQE